MLQVVHLSPPTLTLGLVGLGASAIHSNTHTWRTLQFNRPILFPRIRLIYMYILLYILFYVTGGSRSGWLPAQAKLKSPGQLQELLDVTRTLLEVRARHKPYLSPCAGASYPCLSPCLSPG